MEINYGKNNIYKNSIMSVLYKFIGMLFSLVSAPLLLQCLGTAKYGVWASLLSIISWIYYFDLGVGSGLRNKLAICFAKNDYEDARKYLSISYVMVTIISIIAFIILAMLLMFVDISSLFNIVNIDENINFILTIAIGLACINFVAQLVNNILYAIQKASLVNLFSIISQGLFICGLYIFSRYGISSLLWISILDGASQLIKNVFATLYISKKDCNLKGAFKHIDFSYSSGILSFGIQIFIVQMAALILNSTDNLIILKLYSADAVTPYNFCFKCFNIINTVYVSLISPLLSGYTAAYAQKNYYWIKNALKKNLILFIIFALLAIIACLFFKPVMHVWIHKDLEYEYGLIALMTMYFIVLMFSHIFSTFLTGIGVIKETTIVTVIGAIINIPVSIILAKNFGWGVDGVIAGSIFSILISVAVGPLVSLREIRKMGHS